MKLKTLLLGSAATFMVVGSAQAADLTIAEPVDYVRVCDAIGVGYWYIPGTDTCLKVGGYVQFDANFHSSAALYYVGVVPGSANTAILSHSAGWDFKTEAGIEFTAKSMTEYGILTGYAKFVAVSDNSAGDSHHTKLDNAYLELGPVLAGYTGSTFDYAGGFSDKVYRSDKKTDQIRLTWAMSGFGLMLGIEDPRDRWGTSLGSSYSVPDIIGAITASQGNWDGKLSAGFASLSTGTVWGVNAGVTIKLDSIAPGDQLRLNAAAGTGGSFVGGGTNGATNWSAFASFQHFWSPTLSSAISGGYLVDGGAPANSWAVGGNLVWAPVSGFEASGQVVYSVASGAAGAWTGRIRLKRSW